jgi:hypothetical protein
VRRQLVDEIAPPIYAAIDFVVIIAPSVAVKLAADRGGLGGSDGLDLVVASAVVGLVHAAIAWGRLRSEERIAVRRADMWISAVDALVVLALGATLLLVAILYGFADEHASLADQGYPVVALWVGVQVLAIGLAELVSRLLFRWLEPQRPRPPRWRRSNAPRLRLDRRDS